MISDYIRGVKLFSTLSLLAALAIMLYMSVGQVGGVYAEISVAKTEAAARIINERLSTLTISKADLASGKAHYNGKSEIVYNGNLYDIASSIQQGDKTIIKVLRDEKEEGLLSDLKEIIEEWANIPQSNGKQPLVKQLLTQDFMPVAEFSFISVCPMAEVSTVTKACIYQSPVSGILKSPPQQS
jgi:hypothetical protein